MSVGQVDLVITDDRTKMTKDPPIQYVGVQFKTRATFQVMLCFVCIIVLLWLYINNTN